MQFNNELTTNLQLNLKLKIDKCILKRRYHNHQGPYKNLNKLTLNSNYSLQDFLRKGTFGNTRNSSSNPTDFSFP